MISTAGPPWRVTARTDPRRNARVDWLSAGTVALRAVLTVGAAFIGCHEMEMEFRALANMNEFGVCLRDHPSGTLTFTWPAVAVNGTYTVVSGMSPGGLLSAATGAC